jgi:hypothetical protein
MLFALSQALMKETGFKSTHYSSVFAMGKLFLPRLNYSIDGSRPRKLLVLDDDMVFYKDITPSMDIVHANPQNLTLHCPTDPVLADVFLRNTPDNGDTKRCCISGMMGVPLSDVGGASMVVDLFVNATKEMTRQHPGKIYEVADQDVVNRAHASQKETIDLTPREWSCDFASCKGTTDRCDNCQAGTCHSCHFNCEACERHLNMSKAEWGWDCYFDMDAAELLSQEFAPRAHTTCSNGA